MKRLPANRERRPSRRILLPLAVGVALGASTVAGAAQESASPIDLEPCRGSCSLSLVPEREYGEDSGDGMIEADAASAWLDASGRAYVVGEAAPHVWVFGADGSFLTRIGRRGSGPGEFQDIGSLVITEDGVFSALDRGRGTIATFDWTGELLREVRTEGWLPMGLETLPFESSLVLHAAHIPTPEQIGYPIHVVDLQSGAIRESFGSRTGDHPLGASLDARKIARGPGRSVWMADSDTYTIELWESNSVVRSLRRVAEWFPQPLPKWEGHGWEARPVPSFVDMASDDSLVWVFLYLPDDRWAEAGATRDFDLYYDTVIEVIDWRRGRVLASQRFDECFDNWLEPGLVGRLAVTPTGSVRYQTYRVQPDGGSQDGPAAVGATKLFGGLERMLDTRTPVPPRPARRKQ